MDGELGSGIKGFIRHGSNRADAFFEAFSAAFSLSIQEAMMMNNMMNNIVEIVNPRSGEILNATDADSLIDAFVELSRAEDEIRQARNLIRAALAALTTGDAKTRRVRGKRRRAMVIMPNDAWDQSKLREAWEAYPHLREQCLKIDMIRVLLRNWKTLMNETGPRDFEMFKRLIAAANRGPVGWPTIRVDDEWQPDLQEPDLENDPF
jgi:hypothetical protein